MDAIGGLGLLNRSSVPLSGSVLPKASPLEISGRHRWSVGSSAGPEVAWE